MKYAADMTQLIANTPLVRINKLNKGRANLYAKLEMFNPFSVKDRPSLSMIEAAEKAGLLTKQSTIIEPTSGNTGIGLAFIAAVRGYKMILTMPENMSQERVRLVKALGAEVILTPAQEGMRGAITKAQELQKQIPHSLIPQQFENPNNPAAHTQTAQEIWQDLDGCVDYFVAGVGTGGTITGVGRFLKKENPSVQIIAVEPASSAVLEGKPPAPHKIQGIGAGFVPPILDRSVIDQIIPVTDENAAQTAREIAKQEGLLIGISGGAALWAALQIAQTPQADGKNIVVLLPDSGERYLSTWLFE
ncbi:MAG: cysteine synthase A [Elusimicrobiaceae bacterium]|nr:cysteine synthase A [Elusimicrobiaceae bacterium]